MITETERGTVEGEANQGNRERAQELLRETLDFFDRVQLLMVHLEQEKASKPGEAIEAQIQELQDLEGQLEQALDGLRDTIDDVARRVIEIEKGSSVEPA